MAKIEIIDKLKFFLDEFCNNWEEQGVVYFFVETRKVLEHIRKETGQIRYKVLYFYCNWVVHIEIGHNETMMQQLTSSIYKSIINDKENNSLADFFFFRQLRDEIVCFLQDFGFSYSWVCIDNKPDFIVLSWEKFVGALLKILNEQPLLSQNGNIKDIHFEEINEYNGKITVTYKIKDPEYTQITKEFNW